MAVFGAKYRDLAWVSIPASGARVGTVHYSDDWSMSTVSARADRHGSGLSLLFMFGACGGVGRMMARCRTEQQRPGMRACELFGDAAQCSPSV